MIKEKSESNDIYDNPNKVNKEYSILNKEYSILKYGSKYRFTTCPNESNMLAYAKDMRTNW